MKRSPLFASAAAAALILTSGAQTVHAQKSSGAAALAEPLNSAITWMHLIDAGKFGPSYDTAAAVFRQHVTKDQWQSAAASVHTQIGAFKSRSLLKGQQTTTLPGMPAGNYAVLACQSVFAKAPHVIETITLEQDSDKKWRVIGYFVKPAS